MSWTDFWFTARSSLATGSDTGAEIALTSDPGGGLTIQDALAGQVRARIQPAVTRQLSRRSDDLIIIIWEDRLEYVGEVEG